MTRRALDATPPAGAGSDPWRLWTRALHLFALSAFAIAQPLFDLLARTPEFLLVRRVDAADVLVLTAVVIFAPALVLGLLQVVAGTLGRIPPIAVHLAGVALLGALCALPAIHRVLDLSPAAGVGLAALGGLLLAGSYAWWPGLRALTTWLAAAGLVFPALFLVRPPTSFILAPPAIELASGGASDTPVVMIVFDEFPTFALLGADGRIDATLFPNFARLARDATWFRNATTIATLTPKAVGAILTGTWPGQGPLGGAATRSKNLFTLLGATHDLDVTESYVPFCPPSLCREDVERSRPERLRAMLYDTGVVLLHLLAPPAWADRLPALTYASLLLRRPDVTMREEHKALLEHGRVTHWTNTPAQRSATLTRFIESMAPARRPTLHYLHILLPHVPYVYESSGRICAGWRQFPPPKWWYGSQHSLALHQRLLIQVAWLDGMMGKLLAQLERTGLYDRALLVLVADHGISFRPQDLRRALTRTNACDLLAVPLFIKRPHQRRGGIDDRNVETIDVLPAVADVLGIDVPWPVDGRSALTGAGERPSKRVVGPSWLQEHKLPWKEGHIDFPGDFALRCLASDPPNPEVARGRSPDRLFRRGPFGDLRGRTVRADEIADAAGVRIVLHGPDLSAPVAQDAVEVPCLVEGVVTATDGGGDEVDLAVAINGVIAAVGRSEGLPPLAGSFSIPVPAPAFRDGPNVVELLVPRREGGALRLRRAVIVTPGEQHTGEQHP